MPDRSDHPGIPSTGHGPAALVSACILGTRCRYDGTAKPMPQMAALIEARYSLVPVCPERDGGLPTPRPRSWITGGTAADVLSGTARVIDETGRDVTEHFLAGARAALATAQQYGATVAYLKEHSPSCGHLRTSRDGQRVAGRGVAAELLLQKGITVVSADALGEGGGVR